MKKLSNKEIEQRILKSHGIEYQIQEHAQDVQCPVTVLHTPCGTSFTPILKDFMGTKTRKPTNCPKCSHPSKRLSQEEMEIKAMESDDEYRMTGTYVNTHSKTTFMHLTCGNEFEMRPNNFFIKGNRCPICPRSKGEEGVIEWLKSKKLDFVPQFKPGKAEIGSNYISYDFLVEIAGDKILIEYDGRFHFEPFSNNPRHIEAFKLRQKVDKLKDKYAKDSGYKLIRIHYSKLPILTEELDILFNDYRKHLNG